MAQEKVMNENLFESEADSSVSAESRTLEQALNSTLTSREFAWRNFFELTQSLILVALEFSGNAGDTIDAWLEFDYNNSSGSLSWNTESIKIIDGQAANAGVVIIRIDRQNNFIDHVPFVNMRIKFKKASGANATCPIKGRLLIL